MKISKKVLIPVFASAMGLAVIGGVSGSVAWYQYNSKVTASYIGVSTADTGVLRIREGASGAWGRAVDKGRTGNVLKPTTFNYDEITSLYDMEHGWGTPEAGAGNAEALNRSGSYYEGQDYVPASGSTAETLGYAGWIEDNDAYAQFDLYFDAYQTDATNEDDDGYTHVVRSVYLSNYKVECLTADKIADEAIRIQLDVYDDSDEIAEQIILSKSGDDTNLYGALDLDGSTTPDNYHKTPFNDVPEALDGQPIEYGIHNKVQEVDAISDYASASNALFTTTGEKDSFVHVRITIWLEGWALLNSATKAEWNPFETAGCEVQVGLEFTTGIFRDTDLN